MNVDSGRSHVARDNILRSSIRTNRSYTVCPPNYGPSFCVLFHCRCIVLDGKPKRKLGEFKSKLLAHRLSIQWASNQLAGKVPVEPFYHRTWGRKTEMPDDKMKNQQGGQQSGQRTPGRNPQDDKSTGQRSGGGTTNKEPMHDESHGGGQGGQKRDQGGQKR